MPSTTIRENTEPSYQSIVADPAIQLLIERDGNSVGGITTMMDRVRRERAQNQSAPVQGR